MVLGDPHDPEVEADDDAQRDDDGHEEVSYSAGVTPKTPNTLGYLLLNKEDFLDS